MGAEVLFVLVFFCCILTVDNEVLPVLSGWLWYNKSNGGFGIAGFSTSAAIAYVSSYCNLFALRSTSLKVPFV